MERKRSPRYPSIPLEEAVALARKIHAKDGMHVVEREVAVRHMGYTTLNGASATVLGALGHYGLTEGAGKNQVRLTRRALDILHPEEPEQRISAIEAAAGEPRIFNDIQGRFPDRVPSEDTLKAYLMREGFTPRALDSLAAAYVRTREYVEAECEDERHGGPGQEAAESQGNPHLAEVPMEVESSPGRAMPVRQTAMPTPAPDEWRESVELESGIVSISLPRELTTEDYEDYKEWIAFVHKRLERRLKAAGVTIGDDAK